MENTMADTRYIKSDVIFGFLDSKNIVIYIYIYIYI